MSKKKSPSRATIEPVEITTHLPADFAITVAGHTLNTDVLSSMSPEAISYLLRLGFQTSMNLASFISKPDRAMMQAKGKDPDAISAERAQTRFRAIVSGTVTSGRRVFTKLSPDEKARRLVAKLSDAERAAVVKAMVEGADDDKEDDSRGTVVMLEAAA